jgi:hypothetical protein
MLDEKGCIAIWRKKKKKRRAWEKKRGARGILMEHLKLNH